MEIVAICVADSFTKKNILGLSPMSDRAAWFRREAVSSGTPNPSLGQSWRDYVLRNPEAAAVNWAHVMNERIAGGMPPPVSTDFDSGYSYIE